MSIKENQARVRKEYLRKLIAGVREQMAKDPEMIQARLEYGEEILTSRWWDAEILCLVIEQEVLDNDLIGELPRRQKPIE